MVSRSASSGRSTKKISSNRPFRKSSGGKDDRSLAVAMTNTSCFSPVATSGTPRRVGGLSLRRHRHSRLRQPWLSQFHRSRARSETRIRPSQWLYGNSFRLADEFVEQAAGVELQERQLPFPCDGLCSQRFTAARHPDQHDATRRVRLSAFASSVNPTCARSNQALRLVEPPVQIGYLPTDNIPTGPRP